jgi:hypothetical protein
MESHLAMIIFLGLILMIGPIVLIAFKASKSDGGDESLGGRDSSDNSIE